jgi:hypothetical protein
MKSARILATLLAFTVRTFAQNPAPAPPPAPSPEPPKVIAKETTIYVPFEKLEEVFEGQEQGVFLPYREFLEMWNKVNLPEKLRKSDPPVEGVLAGAKYSGAVNGDVAEIKAALAFEALKDGWSSLKLGAELAIAEAKTTGLLNAADGGHEIIFQNKGAYTLDATIHGRVVRDKGRATLSLKLPRTAVSQFELLVPDKGLEFEVKPAAAFSAVEVEGGTMLAAFFGASQDVTISWAKKGGETALPPLLFADVNLDIRLSAGAMKTDATLTYRILRARVDALKIQLPADLQLLAIEGQNIKEWKPAQGGNAESQLIEVTLHTPVKDAYALRLKLESALGVLPQKPKLPVVAALGVERQSGSVTVSAEGEIIAEPADLAGLTRQAVAQPKDAPPVVAGYRYLRLPFSGTLNVSEAKPQIEAASQTLLTVGTDTLRLDATFAYTVKKAGIFGVQIEVPDGWTPLNLGGGGIDTAEILDVGGKKILTAKFKSRQGGKDGGGFTYAFSLERARAKADDAVTVPVLSPLGVERHDAKVGAAIHVSLKANTTDKGDLREEDIRNLGNLAPQNPAQTPLTLGFRYRSQSAAAVKPAQLAFELRKTRVSAEVLALVDVREALTRHEWTVLYNVEFAGVSEFTIEVPKAIADDLNITGDQIKEKVKTEMKDAAGALTGAVQWRVALQDKVLGAYQLKLSTEAARGEQKPGAVVPVAMHEVKATDVFRETGQVAVIKDGNLEFTSTDAKGLETIDPKELNAELQRDGIFLAYKYSQHPVALSLGVSKNSYLDVPQAVVTYAVLTSVIAEDQAETTEVIYWVKNNAQQFFSLTLPSRGGKDARLLSDAFVNGEPQQPSRRPDRNEVLIRLPAKSEDNAEFAVRFVYEVPSPKPGEKLGARGSFDIQPPALAGVKVMQTKWSLFLPQDHHYTGFGGAMREKLDERTMSRLSRLFTLFVPQVGPNAPGAAGSSQTEPPKLPEPKSAGFDAPLKTEGSRYELRRMEAPAAVTVNFQGKTLAFVLKAVAWLLAFAAGLRLLQRPATARWSFFLFVGIGALIVSGAVNPRAAGPWQAIFFGALCAAGIWVIRDCMRGVAGWTGRSHEGAGNAAYSPAPPPHSAAATSVGPAHAPPSPGNDPGAVPPTLPPL